jgi:hypothetical protein
MARRFTQRKRNSSRPNKVIRVYTEGERTEPNYFNSIRDELRKPEIKIQVYGLGDHTMPLVDAVIREKESVSGTDEETVWWVVIDRDDHPQFNECIEKAEANGINVAYANECFELWFILHFELLDSSIGRDNFAPKLKKLLGVKYEKNMDVYSLIRDKESVAIRNAKKLEQNRDNEGITSKVDRDPSTTVYKLVEELRSL